MPDNEYGKSQFGKSRGPIPTLPEAIERAITQAIGATALAAFHYSNLAMVNQRLAKEALRTAIQEALAQPPVITEAMVERVARELCPLEWAETNAQHQATYRNKARRAIYVTFEAAHGVTQKEETPKEQA